MIMSEQKANVQKLIAALRSGECKQYNQGALHKDGAYCCLGVAAKVLGIDEPTMATWEFDYETMLGPGKNIYLNADTAAKFGFTDEDQRELAHRNDGGSDFNQIAVYLELWLAIHEQDPIT